MSDQRTEIAEFSKFYIDNVPRLVAFLVCSGLSVIDAADCVQETLIEALPPVWGTLKHPYAWCRRVAHRKACDLIQRQQETPLSNPELAGSPLVAHNLDMENFESNNDFLRWMARLRSRKQCVILAWVYDGATPAEIATELNMDPATVRSTLRNARATLRRLRAEGGEQE